MRELANLLGAAIDQPQAVRLVSHHRRLLGVLYREPDADRLVIVDLDRRKK